MGRTAEGWKLRWRGGIAHVRFRHEGERYEITTESRDPSEAAQRAARIYAETVSGRRKPVAARRVATTPLDELIANWIEAFEDDHDATTAATYLGYARATFIPFFGRLDKITSESIADYSRVRLRSVTRKTVQKERGALRSFLEWCHEKHYLDRVPDFPKLPKKATGKRSAKRGKGAKLTEAEVEAFLAALPEWSTRTVRGHRFRVRAFFELMYLTSLRPETLRGIRCPEDYRRGSRELRIRDEIDKARYGRTIDLDARAAALLDEIAPDVGPIFGRHDLRDYAKRAAEKALPPEKAADFVPYDLRHAFARHKLAKTPNLIGVAYLMGHKHLTTTNKYLEGNREEARKVLAAAFVANGGSAPETAPESGSRRASAGSGDDETSGNTGQTGTDDEPSRVQVPVG